MVPRPTKRELESIKMLAQQGELFRELVGWIERSLDETREANDTLAIDKVQLGQGRAQALSAQVKILRGFVNTNSN